VPFIAAWARPDADGGCQRKLPIKSGAVQRQLGTVMDLYPTVLAAAGVAPPAGHEIDGVDLAPQLTGEPNPRRAERFLMHFPHEHRSSYFTAFRDGDWKVICHYFPGRNPAMARYELFNLRDDPFEKQNRAEAEPAVLRRMMAAMVAELEARSALYPVDRDGNERRPVVPSM